MITIIKQKKTIGYSGKIKGFSFIEMVIVMAIFVGLISIGVPMYQSKVRGSKRLDGITSLLNIVQQQALYRNNNQSYGALAAVWGASTTSTKGYYNLSISSSTSAGYVATATAVDEDQQQNDMEDDTNCSPLTVTVKGLATTYEPEVCW